MTLLNRRVHDQLWLRGLGFPNPDGYCWVTLGLDTDAVPADTPL